MDTVLLIDCKIKVGDVLIEHGGLLHVLPIAVHLRFFAGQVVVVVGWVAHEIFVSAQGPLVLGF